MILVVGAGGFLGQRVVKALDDAGVHHVDASHGAGADLHIDLSQPFKPLAIPSGVTHGVVMSSITSVDECFLDPHHTTQFNVTHTIELMKAMLAQHIIPVFVSSDLVFGGVSGNYTPMDEAVPTTTYGKQKRAVEVFLEQNAEHYIIVRLGKLYTLANDDHSPVSGLVQALQNGDTVHAATDQYLTPTLAEDVAQGLVTLILKNGQGIFHLTPTENGSLTRYEMAISVADAIGADRSLVRKCSIDDFTFAEPRPKNSTLNGEKFLFFSGVRLTPFGEVCHVFLPRLFTMSS